MDDLLLRSNRAASVESNLIAGGNDMKMNNEHYRHYLCQQKSLPNHYEDTIDINRQYHSEQDNHLTKLKYFDARQMNNGTAPGFHMQPRGIDDPAFTFRRNILNAKEDNIQIEQMKKVFKQIKLIENLFLYFVFFSRQLKNV
jgi:hypothetical protein